MKSIFILLLSVALASSFYLDDAAIRKRRDNSGVKQEEKSGNGSVIGNIQNDRIDIGYKQNLINSDKNGKVDAEAYAFRTFGDRPRSGIGGQLDWTGDRGKFSLGAEQTRGLGTQFDARAEGIIHKFNENTELRGSAGYSRLYGSPYGSQRPNYHFGLNFVKRF